ncbi:conserved Plasmodium protein, unknown function [Plasmodium ovale wallikeri]|uniref:Uncharacterized protein n=1 Tax=Plasmodium ovale wallikeri TaxID=864142 RepID=A0A1A8YQ53_PLAOA|nr:conserved Plasmodium protein, unknown function [Plasmodium ovale wallikeri]
MDELYEHLKIVDYSLICLLNKYRIIHKYTKHVLNIFVKINDEYNRLIHKVLSTYKQNIYNAVHNKFVELKRCEEKQKEQEKNIAEIKEKLKKAVKLTKSNIKFKSNEEDEERKVLEIDTNLKVGLPYNMVALYRLRHYRNSFLKKRSTIAKNDNYVNANEQRRKFLEKLKWSAKMSEVGKKERSDIFGDGCKNMLRILKESHYFNESQKLKEILIINKYLNKAKNIINNIPHFLFTVIQEFELTESTFQENMYLFILLALNKWLKKIIAECERFVSYPKARGKKKVEDEEYRKFSEYLSDILQRGAEQTVTFNDEKYFFPVPRNMNFNINTSFLTYSLLYMDRNLFDFLRGFYSTPGEKREGKKELCIKEKMISLNIKREESIYMKSAIYNYNLRNESSEKDLLSSLRFTIEKEDVYPNIFLICNYLLQDETMKIIDEIYKIQRNSFDLIFCEDASIIVQIVLCLFGSLKGVFREEAEGQATKRCDDREEQRCDDREEQRCDDREEQRCDDTDGDSENGENGDLRKYLSRVIFKQNNATSYGIFLNPLRLMLLNVLKMTHVTAKSYNRRSICTFWQKLSINENAPSGNESHPNGHAHMENNKSNEGENNDKICNTGENLYECIPINSPCDEKNCYLFSERRKTKEETKNFEMCKKASEAIQRRILCYDFHQAVQAHVKKVKLDIENRNNRDIYTGILLKKNKYKIDGNGKDRNYKIVGESNTHFATTRKKKKKKKTVPSQVAGKETYSMAENIPNPREERKKPPEQGSESTPPQCVPPKVNVAKKKELKEGTSFSTRGVTSRGLADKRVSVKPAPVRVEGGGNNSVKKLTNIHSSTVGKSSLSSELFRKKGPKRE